MHQAEGWLDEDCGMEWRRCLPSSFCRVLAEYIDTALQAHDPSLSLWCTMSFVVANCRRIQGNRGGGLDRDLG